MSNNAGRPVPNVAQDPRIRRSTNALGRALIELIQERAYDEITVQQILDRAGVGRATFYAHYRNKDDALHSAFDGLFAWASSLLDRNGSAAARLFPVREFVAHITEQRELADGLRRSGLIEDLWESFAGHAAAIVERRLATWPPPASGISRPLLARMLAGALVETVRWHQEHPSRATPEYLDSAFHELARGVCARVLR